MKKNLSKLTMTFAAAAIAVPCIAVMPTEAATMPFTDINKQKDAELYQAVTELYSKGIVFGTTSTTFSPYATLTRGEAAKFIAVALNLDTKNVKNPNFKDIPTSHKYYPYIAALAANGIIDGTRENFNPTGEFKRSHVAKMLTLGFKLDQAKTLSAPFTDFTPNKETNIYIQTILNYGITQGTTKTTFSPNTSISRKQMTLFLYRTMNSVSDDFFIVDVQ